MKKIIYLILFVLLINTAFALEITNIISSPVDEVEAGRALLVSVEFENDEPIYDNSIKITTSIPKLGISASGDIESRQGSTTGEGSFYLRIPQCTELGDYEIEIILENEQHESVKEKSIITIIEGRNCMIEEKAKGEEVKLKEDKLRIEIVCPKACNFKENEEEGECVCPSNYGYCSEIGIRTQNNSLNLYCLKGLLFLQKNISDSCDNNFECKTNFCSNNSCYDISKQVEENTNLLYKIFNWLKSFF